MLRIYACFLVIPLLAGCGQKGPLYLPTSAPPRSERPARLERSPKPAKPTSPKAPAAPSSTTPSP